MDTSRVSTLAAQRTAIMAITAQQGAANYTQLQLATGQRIVNPSDDPLGTQRIMALETGLGRVRQFRANADLASMRLSLEDNALASATDVLQRARELIIQAGSGTQGPDSRALIATELRALGETLLDIGNARNGQGEYLFGGYRSQTQPFSRSASGVIYNGDQGQRMLRIGESQSVADGDSGHAVFERVVTGNGVFSFRADSGNAGAGIAGPTLVVDETAYDGSVHEIRFTAADAFDVVDGSGAVIASGSYQSGQGIAFSGLEVTISGTPAAGDVFRVEPSTFQDVFTTLDSIAAALESASGSDSVRAFIQSELNAGLADIDQGISHLTAFRAEVGNRLANIEVQQQSNDDYELQLSSTLSDVQDLDFVAAVGRLNSQLNALQAAQASYARVQGLSLFNFI